MRSNATGVFGRGFREPEREYGFRKKSRFDLNPFDGKGKFLNFGFGDHRSAMRDHHANRFIRDHPADSRVTDAEMGSEFFEGQQPGSHRIAPSRKEYKNQAEAGTNRCRHRDRFDKLGREKEESGAELGRGINWGKGISKTSTESPNTGSSLRGEVGSIPTLAGSKAIEL